MHATINPKTRTVDYADLDTALVSVEAVNKGWVRTSLGGQALQSAHHVLPLYITRQHWQAIVGSQSLIQALQVLCPEYRANTGASPPTHAWLQALPKLLNTTVVLLMDNVRVPHF